MTVLKKIKVLLIISFVGAVGFLGYRYLKNPPGVYPYPYIKPQVDPKEIAEAEKADVIILGDSAALELQRFLPQFIEETAKNLREPLKIYNWGAKGEGLPHITAKVKSLKKMPLLFIYHGGLDELDRQRIAQKAIHRFEKNLKLAHDPETMTTLMSFPPLARLYYWTHPRVTLESTASPYPSDITAPRALRTLELLYSIYQWEAKELFTHLKLRDARMWVIPQAYNIEEKPYRVCESATSILIEKKVKEAIELIEKNQTKLAYNILRPLVEANKGHALLFHTLGLSFLKSGEFSKAKKAFYQAMLYDCSLKRSNPLFLKILMEEAEKRDFTIIDFNRMVTNYLGRNKMFESSRIPHNFYYQKLTRLLIKKFNEFMKK